MEAPAKKDVLYCAGECARYLAPSSQQVLSECGLPAEYCEYGPDVRKCLPWLRQHAAARVATDDQIAELFAINDAVHKTKRGEGELAAEVAAVAAEAAATEGGEGAPTESKGEPKKKRAAKVTVSRQQRSKRKFLTVVSGLDRYQVAGPAACSAFKKKFACGATVDKETGDVEIQGDVTYEVADFICEAWPQIDKKNIKFSDK